MRTAVGYLTCLTAMASLAYAAPQADTPPTYQLRGYYQLDQHPTWLFSDSSPWIEAKHASWVNARLVQWGYVPFTHGSQHYYCLIDNGPRTGSHIPERTFMCGDPATAQWLFQNNWRPALLQYGGASY